MLRRFVLAVTVTLALPVGNAVLGLQDPDDGPPVGTQDPETGPDNLERDVFGRVRRPPGGGESPLIGAWQLLDIVADGFPEEGITPTGYMLIGDGFLAFEMHVSWDDFEVGGMLIDGFQTFIAEYSLIGGSVLQCRTLIGSYLETEDEELNYEPPGFPREFQVEVDKEFLKLSWEGNESMTFGRRRAGLQGRVDVFGKTESLKSHRRGADIFGREGVVEEKGDEKGDDQEEGGGGGR